MSTFLSPVKFLCSKWPTHPAPKESPVVSCISRSRWWERWHLLPRAELQPAEISRNLSYISSAEYSLKGQAHLKALKKALTSLSKAQSWVSPLLKEEISLQGESAYTITLSNSGKKPNLLVIPKNLHSHRGKNTVNLEWAIWNYFRAHLASKECFFPKALYWRKHSLAFYPLKSGIYKGSCWLSNCSSQKHHRVSSNLSQLLLYLVFCGIIYVYLNWILTHITGKKEMKKTEKNP